MEEGSRSGGRPERGAGYPPPRSLPATCTSLYSLPLHRGVEHDPLQTNLARLFHAIEMMLQPRILHRQDRIPDLGRRFHRQLFRNFLLPRGREIFPGSSSAGKMISRPRGQQFELAELS